MHTESKSTKKMHIASRRPKAESASEYERLQEALGVATPKEVAFRLGAKLPTVKSWKLRGSVPTEVQVKAARDSGCTLQWLVSGEPPKFLAPKSTESNQSRHDGELVQKATNPPNWLEGDGLMTQPARHRGARLDNSTRAPDVSYPAEEPQPPPVAREGSGLTLWPDARHIGVHYQVVPRYEVRVSAGTGKGEPDGDSLIGEFAFRVDWMRKHLGRSGRGFASLEVRGDSMQPTLMHGDEIIIDRHVLRVDVNGIYVIALRGDLLVKRVQRMLDGSLVVKSDNAAYAPELVTAEQAEGIRVVGRLVWPRVR